MADMGKTEVDATVQETVSTMIQKFLIEESKLMTTVQNFPVAPGEDLIKIPRAGGFTVNDKVENTAVTAQVLTYATDDLPLDLYKTIQVLLEDNAELQAKPAIVSDIVSRMGKQIALQVDTDIVGVLEDVSLAAPDHAVAYDNAASLGKADILTARELLHAQNIVFSECYIGVTPASEADLLAIDDFVHVDKYGSTATGLVNGELGRLYGAPVIMSNEFDTLKTIVWHPSHCAFAMQMATRFETQRELDKLATLYSIAQLYGVKQLDSGKRAVLLGTAAP